jgi:hypothetical protein
MDITTDFGQIEQVIQGKIDKNRAKVRVAADLSQEGIESIKAEERMEKAMAEDALVQFEAELGLRSPETTKLADANKELGPAVTGDKATQTTGN